MRARRALGVAVGARARDARPSRASSRPRRRARAGARARSRPPSSASREARARPGSRAAQRARCPPRRSRAAAPCRSSSVSPSTVSAVEALRRPRARSAPRRNAGVDRGVGDAGTRASWPCSARSCPTPFAMPAIVTRAAADAHTRALRASARVSVVMIARAASPRPSAASAPPRRAMPRRIFAIGSGCRSRPSRRRASRSARAPTARAAARRHRRGVAHARARPSRRSSSRCSRRRRARGPRARARARRSTGAPTTVERVKTPAAARRRVADDQREVGAARLDARSARPPRGSPGTASGARDLELRGLKRAAALLVLLAAAARARIVAADLRDRAAPARARRARRRRAAPRPAAGSAAARAAPRRAARRGAARGASARAARQHELEDAARAPARRCARSSPRTAPKPSRWYSSFGSCWRVAAQADALAQAVHRVQVVLPLRGRGSGAGCCARSR